VNTLSTKRAPRPKLEYPFGLSWSPKPGEPFEVAEGVYWLRVPLPIALDHINLWLLRDGDAWVIVDSGFDAPVCKEVWETVFDGFLAGQTVSKIIITHFHPDHIGLASWLALRCQVPVLITKGEFYHYHSIVNRNEEAYQKTAQRFLNEMGFSTEDGIKLAQFMQADKKPPEARVQESMCEFIQEGDQIVINEKAWNVVCGNGHSPEHACLYCPDLAVMISGDQAIPRISSNVSVYPSNRDGDPLGDWLNSCEKLRDTIPESTLILPSHQEPFVGLALRMQQLIDDHHAQLNSLRIADQSVLSTFQARSILFNRELNTVETMLATGETLAHLNYLLHREELSMQHDANGVALYQKQS